VGSLKGSGGRKGGKETSAVVGTARNWKRNLVQYKRHKERGEG